MTIVNNGSICYEVDRQIKETLARRNNLYAEINSVKMSISKHSRFWIRNDEKHIQAKKELSERLHMLEGMYNAAVYTFRESATDEFVLLKKQFGVLCSSYTRTYDNTPSNRGLMIAYNPKGDMKSIHFSVEPLCLALGRNVFCVIPYYIIHFRSNGDYVAAYSSKDIRGGLTNGSYNERIRHVTWSHTRVDGRPDMRYKNNPQRVYYTTRTHTVYNMLAIDIANNLLKYEVDDSVKYNLISAIRNYSALVPTKTYDSSYHLLRLLKLCDENNTNLARLESIIGTTFSDEYSQANTASSSQTDNVSTPVKMQKSPSMIKIILYFFTAALSGSLSLFLLIYSLDVLSTSEWGAFLIYFSISSFLILATYVLISDSVRSIRLRKNPQYETNRKTSRKIVIIVLSAMLSILHIIGLFKSCSGTVTVTDTKESNASSVEAQESVPSQETTQLIVYSESSTTTETTPQIAMTVAKDRVQYTYDDKLCGYVVTSAEDVEKIVIPEKINDVDVVAIGEKAFSEHEKLKSIILPNTIVEIRKEAFYSCKKLTAFVFPKKVTVISDSVLSGCHSLKKITISGPVTTIGYSAFDYCPITSIKLPSSLRTIDDEAFLCTNLTKVTIPEGVISIGKGAFKSTELVSISLPNSLTSIGNQCFRYCNKLKSVRVPPKVKSIDHSVFWQCGCKKIYMPSDCEITGFLSDGKLVACDAKLIRYKVKK